MTFITIRFAQNKILCNATEKSATLSKDKIIKLDIELTRKGIGKFIIYNDNDQEFSRLTCESKLNFKLNDYSMCVAYNDFFLKDIEKKNLEFFYDCPIDEIEDHGTKH